MASSHVNPPPGNQLSFEQIKTLADPRRMKILRSLMATPGSLTSLGEAIGEHPAWIRHHLLKLEQAGLILLDHTQTSGGRTEKYYRAASPVLLLQEAILPDFLGQDSALLMGSHDLALEAWIQAWLASHETSPHVVSLPVGSLDGLNHPGRPLAPCLDGGQVTVGHRAGL